MPTLWLSFLYMYELSDCGESLSFTAQILEQAERRVCLGQPSQLAEGLNVRQNHGQEAGVNVTDTLKNQTSGNDRRFSHLIAELSIPFK